MFSLSERVAAKILPAAGKVVGTTAKVGSRVAGGAIGGAGIGLLQGLGANPNSVPPDQQNDNMSLNNGRGSGDFKGLFSRIGVDNNGSTSGALPNFQPVTKVAINNNASPNTLLKMAINYLAKIDSNLKIQIATQRAIFQAQQRSDRESRLERGGAGGNASGSRTGMRPGTGLGLAGLAAAIPFLNQYFNKPPPGGKPPPSGEPGGTDVIGAGVDGAVTGAKLNKARLRSAELAKDAKKVFSKEELNILEKKGIKPRSTGFVDSTGKFLKDSDVLGALKSSKGEIVGFAKSAAKINAAIGVAIESLDYIFGGKKLNRKNLIDSAGGIAGGVVGGIGGAIAGSFLGPVGSIAGGVAGNIGGDIAGRKFANWLTGSSSKNKPVKATPAGNRTAEAMKFFMSHGWTKEQAAGIVGNLQQESGGNLDPRAKGDYQNGIPRALGIAQWHKERRDLLKAKFGVDPANATFRQQLGFVQYELTQGSRKGAGTALMKASNATDAAKIVDSKFENSLGSATASRVANAVNLSGSKPANSKGYAGLNLKSGATSGGAAAEATTAFAQLVNSNISGINRFTAFSDDFHKGKRSAHNSGKAFDFTLKDPSKSSEVARQIKELADKNGVKVKILDEYKNPSKGATGGHIHVTVQGPGVGSSIVGSIMSGAQSLGTAAYNAIFNTGKGTVNEAKRIGNSFKGGMPYQSHFAKNRNIGQAQGESSAFSSDYWQNLKTNTNLDKVTAMQYREKAESKGQEIQSSTRVSGQPNISGKSNQGRSSVPSPSARIDPNEYQVYFSTASL